LLSTNNLADLPVLPDEMVVTALTNTTMKITNPLGYQTSEESQTIAGGDIWSIDVNDGSLDEQVIDYNLLLGEYEMTFLWSRNSTMAPQPLTSAVRIDGSQQATIFDSYTFGSSKSQGNRAEGCLPPVLLLPIWLERILHSIIHLMEFRQIPANPHSGVVYFRISPSQSIDSTFK
jgi:hypothetical protein